MNRSWLRAQLLFPLFALACGSASNSRPADAGADDAASPTADTALTDDGGLAEDDGGADDALASYAIGLAVVHGDQRYTSSLISLLDPNTGALVRDNCLNSGTEAPGLSQGLTGDVVLPSAPLPGHPLILIDRKNSTLTWVAPATCSVTRQISVKANPHDVLALTANKLYVTRYETNAKPTTPLDGGGDLLVLDMAQGQAVARIDLAPYAAGTGSNPNPDRGWVLDGKIYVTLNSFDSNFAKAGTGRVVVIDPATDTVTGTIDLPGLQNCGPIAPVPGMPKALAVSCAGPYGADQIKVSGIALIDTSAMPPTVTAVMASAFGRPLSMSNFAVVGPGLALVVVPGDASASLADALWRFDFSRGVPQKVLTSSWAYTLGGLVYHPASQRVFIGDADTKTPRVRVMDVSGGLPVELTSINSAPGGLLPLNLGLY